MSNLGFARVVAAVVGCGVLLGSLGLPVVANAGDRAREILVESESRHRTSSEEYAGELAVTTKKGKVRRKGWRSFRQGYAGDARLLIRFTAPAEVRGVGFLSLGRDEKTPDQWLYLPSMKRERRIASRDRGASFVGTDFNFEDMEPFDHTDFDVDLVGEETIDGVSCHLIELTPLGRSLYARKIVAIRKDLLFLVRSESFRKGEKKPWKRLELSDLDEVDGHWVARRMQMTDLEKQRHTVVLLTELHFDKEQPDDRFTIQNLNREE